jgi:peptidoglycan/LPS O-acetylase OafA/YrhL
MFWKPVSNASRSRSSNSSISAPNFNYVPTLDGWRALAVAGVIYYHARYHSLTPGSIWFLLAGRGYLGVDLFFAISGFLICGKLLTELQQTHTISWRRFYVRRFLRIVPPLWTYLLVLLGMSRLGWLTVGEWEFTSSLLFLRNYFPLFANQAPLGVYTAHFWSLAVEEHFYLFWSFMMMLLLRLKVRSIGWWTLVVALCVFLWRCLDATHGWLIPYATNVESKSDTRMDALLWGCLAAVLYPWLQARLKAWGHASIGLFPALLLVLVIPFRTLWATLLEAILFPALLVSTATFPDTWVGRILESPILRWIGRLSYSIYIWQELAMFPESAPHSPLHAIQHFPINILVILVCATLSYYGVEKPLIRRGRNWRREISVPLRAGVAILRGQRG